MTLFCHVYGKLLNLGGGYEAFCIKYGGVNGTQPLPRLTLGSRACYRKLL
jgi:hypothetical protein